MAGPITVTAMTVTPKTVTLGATVTIFFSVRYPDNSPVTLVPSTIGIKYTVTSGPGAGTEDFGSVKAAKTGPGNYVVIQTLPQGPGVPFGKATFFIKAGSASDALGYTGPTSDFSTSGSIITITPLQLTVNLNLLTHKTVTVTVRVLRGTTLVALVTVTLSPMKPKASFTFNLPGGTYTVRISGPGIATQAKTVTIPPSKSVTFFIL